MSMPDGWLIRVDSSGSGGKTATVGQAASVLISYSVCPGAVGVQRFSPCDIPKAHGPQQQLGPIVRIRVGCLKRQVRHGSFEVAEGSCYV